MKGECLIPRLRDEDAKDEGDPGALAPWPEINLIDQLLTEQQSLTAVERFSQKHERADFPVHAQYYRDLIPLTKPAPGQQYAFEVNLDKCTGCKACVSACHSLNGLEETETWRDTGLIVGASSGGLAYQQTVTSACHHCADPACANGCPVLAYEKDEETGIVRHLDDQCIGCQYCSLKCPYDVPKYSKSKGIVRKCDMCHSRLAVGEAPACVQACPTSAIRIVTITKQEIAKNAAPGTRLVPGAFRSSYTQPSTRYLTKRSVPADALPADARRPRVEHGHLPLVFMLTLTQIATGLLLGAAIASLIPNLNAQRSTLAFAAATALLLGLGASVLHLGQPLKAWRVFLGLRKSWLSREVVAFGALPPLAIGAIFLPKFLALPAATYAVLCVFTSVMVYADTHRELWKFPRTMLRFYGTAAIFAGGGLSLSLSGMPAHLAAAATAGAVATKLFFEIRFLRQAARLDASCDSLSAQLLSGPLRHTVLARNLTAIAGAVLLSFGLAPLAVCGLLLLGVSEWIERCQFFSSVVAYRMPGGS